MYLYQLLHVLTELVSFYRGVWNLRLFVARVALEEEFHCFFFGIDSLKLVFNLLDYFCIFRNLVDNFEFFFSYPDFKEFFSNVLKYHNDNDTQEILNIDIAHIYIQSTPCNIYDHIKWQCALDSNIFMVWFILL